ncbi:MAG TPA: cyclic nucleotide-binding domain-containing protein [Elusimicrobiota bacterium]|nr:cyclic nucleotide-binding domain-containing protein [Elusimicrobiota bacterium]
MTITNDEARWLYKALKQIEFLKFCSIGEIEELAQNLVKKTFKTGETIVRQGDPGDYLFLLYSGEVSIQARSAISKRHELTRLGAGNYFGEMALVSREPRNATVVATQDSEAFLLYAAEFRKLLDKNQDLARTLEDLVARRKAARELELRRSYQQSQALLSRLKRWLGF